MIEFRTLETFFWVAQLKSFRGAAARLNTTQPAVSQRIAQLEEQLGTRLLERSSRSFVLTEVGRSVLVQAERRLLSQADEIVLMVDSGKFAASAAHVLCALEDVAILVTDNGLGEHIVRPNRSGNRFVVRVFLRVDQEQSRQPHRFHGPGRCPDVPRMTGVGQDDTYSSQPVARLGRQSRGRRRRLVHIKIRDSTNETGEPEFSVRPSDSLKDTPCIQL